jgi:hypothetical protein
MRIRLAADTLRRAAVNQRYAAGEVSGYHDLVSQRDLLKEASFCSQRRRHDNPKGAEGRCLAASSPIYRGVVDSKGQIRLRGEDKKEAPRDDSLGTREKRN